VSQLPQKDAVFYNNFIISFSNNKMETRYALLGKKLFEKCKTSQATSEDISERLSHLRRWNQGKIDYDDNFLHSEHDNKYLRKLLSPIDLNVPFDTPATQSELQHFAEVCGLTRDAVDVTDLFTYDWRKHATEYIDPSTGLQYFKLPKGSILYHGMDIKYPFDITRVPKYFGTLTTAYPYGFVSRKNNRTAEQGKVVPFRLKEDILVLNITSLENWKILMPTEENVPEDVLLEADESFYYKPNSGRKFIGRTSTTKGDNVIYNYILSLPQTSIASAAGSRGGHEEIVFTDMSKLQKVGYELPYEIVMVNDLSRDSNIECAFAIEARSTVDDPSFRLVATLSEQEIRAGRYGPSAEEGDDTFNIPYKEKNELRKKCLERALGNVEVITPYKPPVEKKRVTYKSATAKKIPSHDEESSSSEEEKPIKRVVRKSASKKPIKKYSSDEESD
jgi:hypothetical protein